MIFFSLILIVGILTTYTDLKSQKIYNHHLIIGAILGIFATVYTGSFEHENFFLHIVNGLTAFIIGFLLHRVALWRGGDAKLFTLFAFLMPPPNESTFLLQSTVSLFACSFIFGMIILLPIFIKDILVNRATLATEVFSPIKTQAILAASAMTLFYSWLLFPLFHFARLTNPIFNLTIMFLIFSVKYTPMRTVKEDLFKRFFKRNLPAMFICVVFGYGFRLLIIPETLTLPHLAFYAMTVLFYSILMIGIHSTLDHFKNYKERIAFAPLIFIGCLLSYTPFFIWVTHAIGRG